MRIQGPNGPTGPQRPEANPPSGPQRPEANPPSGHQRAADASKPGPTDRAEFSEEARRVAALADAAARLPEVRTDRVDALRGEIEGGTYRVDARSLARAILEFEDDFARR